MPREIVATNGCISTFDRFENVFNVHCSFTFILMIQNELLEFEYFSYEYHMQAIALFPLLSVHIWVPNSIILYLIVSGTLLCPHSNELPSTLTYTLENTSIHAIVPYNLCMNHVLQIFRFLENWSTVRSTNVSVQFVWAICQPVSVSNAICDVEYVYKISFCWYKQT